MTCRWKPWQRQVEEVDEAVMHGKNTTEVSLDEESETNRALRREIRKLSEAVSKLELEEKRQKGEKKKCRRCLLSRCNRGEQCPANTKRCHRCGEQGHFSRSTLCKGVKKVQEECPAKQEMVAGVIREGDRDSRIRVSLGIAKQGASFGAVRVSLLADTGVRRTILNLGDWEQLGRGELKETRLKFRPYGTNQYLPIIGRAAVRLKAKAGAVIDTEVYVNEDRSEDSLLGEKDAERLGIVTVRPEGAAREVEIRRIKQNCKAGLEKEDQTVMRDQKLVDEEMDRVAKEYKEVFEGIGKYKGPPVEIQVEEGVRPVVQPPRRIPLHYQEPLKEHIQELLEAGVIEGPLQHEEEGTWVSNLVITGKK